MIDDLNWGRAALDFIEMSIPFFEDMAGKLTSEVAFEVVLLAVANKCEKEPTLWDTARRIGIPWRIKSWRSITRLQKSYNDAVSSPLYIVPKKSLLLLGNPNIVSDPSEYVRHNAKEMRMGSLATDFHCMH